MTLLVNLSGSLAIGLLVPLTEHVSERAPALRPFLVVGFLGGWTTYSTLAVDATLLTKDGDVGTCLAYLAQPSPVGWCSWCSAMGRPSVGATVSSSPTLGLALVVAAAGGAGATGVRLLIHHIGSAAADPLPVGTMMVNASGSLLLGVLTGLSLYHGLGSHVLAVAGVGLCGGYTTWSTASWETIHLVHTGHQTPSRHLHTREPRRLYRRGGGRSWTGRVAVMRTRIIVTGGSPRDPCRFAARQGRQPRKQERRKPVSCAP